ncbi:MAG: hypothetical protein QOI99_1810 [Actinomycetota bacterium]|nr:hypothetical protein [Actinomycetota bacterium]
MADGVLVLVLLVFIWAAVLLPPAAGARASREAEFLGSIRPDGHPHENGVHRDAFAAVDQPRFRPALSANARRRQVLGGLVVAVGATLLLGLLPPFHLLLVVHLLVVNSCLAYVGLLVHMRDERASMARVASTAAGWREEPAGQLVATGVDADAYGGAEAFEYRQGGFEDGGFEDGGFEDGDEPAYVAAGAGAYQAEDGWADAYQADDDGWADADQADAYQAEGYRAGDGGEDDGWDEDDEAEAAWVDEELGLRRAV